MRSGDSAEIVHDFIIDQLGGTSIIAQPSLHGVIVGKYDITEIEYLALPGRRNGQLARRVEIMYHTDHFRAPAARFFCNYFKGFRHRILHDDYIVFANAQICFY